MLNAQLPATVTPVVDLRHPSVARVYDFLLGGSAHWAIDRSFALRILDQFPEFRNIARANRWFVNRVVRHLARRGVRQFLDIGSGVLTAGNTHQVADEIAPDARVVYVDNEAVAVAHAEIMLDEEGDPDRHAVINADLRQPDRLWEQALATGVLNAAEPVAVLMFSVLHTLRPEPGGNDLAARIMARYRELIPVGSYLGVSHVTDDEVPPELAPKLANLKQLCDDWCGTEVFCRSHAEVNALLGDFRRVPPGMVWIPQWHPEEARPYTEKTWFAAPNHAVVWAGVGQK